jgi:hypothetical protein
VFWLPTATPFTIVLSPAPPELVGERPATALPLAEPRSFSPYEAIGEIGHQHPLLMLGEAGDKALVALVPLDADLPQRIDSLTRLWRRLLAGRTEPAGALTPQRRRRLVETLRALDGHLDGATTREVAAGLFGEDRLPRGPDWKSHDLRARAKRLIGAGRALMNGGYRALLRPPR